MVNSTEKAQYRKWAKELRQTLDLKKKSKGIIEKIQVLNEYKSAKTVMSYMAKDIEISLNDLFQDNSKSWFLPVILKRQEEKIVVVPYLFNKTKLLKGKFDIYEPEIVDGNYYDQLERKISLDLIFVPGLCFDKLGNRLGFGLGFYDEFLKLNPNSFKVGCCPKECLVDKLSSKNWDVKVDLLIID